MPTNKYPVEHQAFQQSRSRLLKPSEIFNKSRREELLPSPQLHFGTFLFHPPPQSTYSRPNALFRAQAHLNSLSRYQSSQTKPNYLTVADLETETVPRSPHFLANPSSSLSKSPRFTTVVSPLEQNKLSTTPRAPPYLSRSQIN